MSALPEGADAPDVFDSTNTRDAEPTPQVSVVRRAVLLIVFVCLALLAINTWLLYQSRTHEISQVAQANSNLANAVSQQVDGSVAEVEHIVNGLVFDIERTDMSRAALENMQPTLVGHVAGVEQLKGLFVFDASGRWAVTSEAIVDVGFNNADREYFAFHRDNASTALRVGAPIVSRSSNEWVIPVSRRINDADGKFAGVVLATLDLKHYRHMLAGFNIGAKGAVALIQADRLILRIPSTPTDAGRTIPASPLLESFRRQQAGTADERSPLDGVDRLISFSHTLNYPLLVAVAVGKDDALEDWRAHAAYISGVMLACCAIVVAAGVSLIRSLRLRLDAESRLRETRDGLTEANGRLSRMARYDGLTGLPNRRYFDERLVRVFGQAQRQKRPMAIVMVDVDEFKKFNDLYGHLAGDECLKRVANALRLTSRRPEDMVARYGGEEIVLLLPETDAAGAMAVAEAARLAVTALGIEHAGTSLGVVSVSLGVAAWIPASQEISARMLTCADSALYRAKQLGRNRVAEYI